jgi:hypothetical protein
MSLTVVLWNIKLTGKCSKLLDLATANYDLPSDGSPFSQTRDSLGIVAMMNQYSVHPDFRASDAVNIERLLRVALFYNMEIPDPHIPDTFTSTQALRAKLAKAILIRRRRGVVPNMLTYLVRPLESI